jgi:hypothetical protein
LRIGLRFGLAAGLHLLLHHLLIHPRVKRRHQRRAGHAVRHRHVMQRRVVDLMQIGNRFRPDAPHQHQRKELKNAYSIWLPNSFISTPASSGPILAPTP